MNALGPIKIYDIPYQQQGQLFKMLAAFLGDANQETRIYARKAILSLEYGENPLPSRADAI